MSKTNKINVMDDIVVHAVFPEENEKIVMLHTHGMERFGRPNLLVESNEIFLLMAASLLNTMCDWLLNGIQQFEVEKAKEEPIKLSGMPDMAFREIEFEGEKVWEIYPTERPQCDTCSCCPDGKPPENVTKH